MKNLKLITIALLCLFTCVINVSADEDFSNVKVSVAGLKEDSHTGAYIKVSDVTLSDVTSYYAVFTKDTNAPDSFTTSSYPEFYDSLSNIDDEIRIDTGYEASCERFGDVYITFYSGSGETFTKVSDPVLIKRPEELKLSKRFIATLASDITLLRPQYISYDLTKKNVNYKFGEVTDNAILRKIKNGDYSGLEELLAYGKKGTNVIKSSKTELKYSGNGYNEVLYEQNQVTEGKYYYLYLEIDTEDGKYYPVEDINLYQAYTSSASKKELYNYTDSNFKWNIDEATTVEATVTTTTEEKKVDNPKTGTIATCIIAGLGAATLVGTIIYIKTRKASKFPQA